MIKNVIVIIDTTNDNNKNSRNLSVNKIVCEFAIKAKPENNKSHPAKSPKPKPFQYKIYKIMAVYDNSNQTTFTQ